MKKVFFIVALFIFLTGCSGGANAMQVTEVAMTRTPTPTPTETPTVQVVSSETPTSAYVPGSWRQLPISPTISAEMIAIYQAGLALGRNPDRFSKIGDCQNITPYFLAAFDNPTDYRLGTQYASLQATIDHFAGSWSRQSIAVHGGMNVAAVQSPFWDLTPRPTDCRSGESPLACEIRVYNASFAIISMEESWNGDIVKYDHYMRAIVEYALSQDVVPILATRAELPDAPISINETVARIAYDYHVPLWNFWAAADPLPSHGLTGDGFHLTPEVIEKNYYFDDPERMKLGWVWRNLSALQSIDTVWRGVSAGH